MNIFGFVVPNINGIEEIEIAAKCKDGIVFPLAVITLLAQSAIFQPFMGKNRLFYYIKFRKANRFLLLWCSIRKWKPTKLRRIAWSSRDFHWRHLCKCQWPNHDTCKFRCMFSYRVVMTHIYFHLHLQGGLNKLIMGIFELLRGNVELSIDYQRQAFPTLRRIGKTYLVCYALNIVNHEYLFVTISELFCALCRHLI